MKREEAIKAIEDNRPRSGYIILNEALDMAITALQNQPVWIPVSERLPGKDSGDYPINMVTLDTGEVCIGVYRRDSKEWWTMNEGETLYNTDHVVVSWMPLPEPYRESEPHKQTNADRIRSMTDKELAEMLSVVSQHCVVYLSDHIDCRHSRCESSCKSNIKKWLQKESEE